MANAESPTVGTRIRAERVQAGLTQTQLGDLVGVKQQSVAKWEDGGTITIERLEAIAEVLQIPVRILLGEPTNETTVPSRSNDADHVLELSASGVDLEELRRLDPQAYELIVRQAELALDRARERREQS